MGQRDDWSLHLRYPPGGEEIAVVMDGDERPVALMELVDAVHWVISYLWDAELEHRQVDATEDGRPLLFDTIDGALRHVELALRATRGEGDD